MCPLCQLSNQDTIFHVNFFYTVVAKCYKKYMPPINAFCINCNISIKPQSVDAFCTKNFSLMQNASTLPTHFVTKNQNAPIVTLMQNALYQSRHDHSTLTYHFTSYTVHRKIPISSAADAYCSYTLIAWLRWIFGDNNY